MTMIWMITQRPRWAGASAYFFVALFPPRLISESPCDQNHPAPIRMMSRRKTPCPFSGEDGFRQPSATQQAKPAERETPAHANPICRALRRLPSGMRETMTTKIHCRC